MRESGQAALYFMSRSPRPEPLAPALILSLIAPIEITTFTGPFTSSAAALDQQIAEPTGAMCELVHSDLARVVAHCRNGQVEENGAAKLFAQRRARLPYRKMGEEARSSG